MTEKSIEIDKRPLLSFSDYRERAERKKFIKKSIIVIGLVLIIFLISISGPKRKTKKNIIFMVTDGMGPASLSLARSFRQHRDGLAIDDILTLDKHLIGSSRTRSNSSLVTDSAAGATAFSCGLKSYNGAIGVDSEKAPCGTILEALKLQGYLTGLVVTTRITDATPASFNSHVDYRFQEDLIAEQQLGASPLGRVTDLMIGGGRCHFLPSDVQGGCRSDNRNLIEEATNKGSWSYVGNREEFDQLQGGKNVTLPLLGLLASTDIPYDIDRNSTEYPSLAEEVKVALTALSEATKNSEKGFFLMIEGSRIDHAGHHNDAAAQVREVLAYDQAFAEVLDFVDNSDTDTVVIGTSDHETGGLVTARQVSESYPDYLWYPEILLKCQHSGEFLVRKIQNYQDGNSGYKTLDDYLVKEIIQKDMGIENYSADEIRLIKNNKFDSNKLLYVLNNMISLRSQTGWTTHGHSAVDVNIYAYTNSEVIRSKLFMGKVDEGLAGNHENIEIGKFMARTADADLEEITRYIKNITHSPSLAIQDLGDDSYHQNIIIN